MASIAIKTTVRTWTTLCCRSAATSSDRFGLKRDDYGKDHAEHGLKNRVVGRVKCA
jgi:hypothetical protein